MRAPSLFIENPVCGPSTRALGTPESDIITVKGVAGAQTHMRNSSKSIFGGEEIRDILIEKEQDELDVMGVSEYY